MQKTTCKKNKMSTLLVEKVGADGSTLAQKEIMHTEQRARDLTGSTFVELAAAYKRKYEPDIRLSTAPVFKLRVDRPDGSVRRYRNELEARNHEVWSRSEYQALRMGLIPDSWHATTNRHPRITSICETWDEKKLPADNSYARQQYRQLIQRRGRHLASNDTSGWQALFADARHAAWEAARRYPEV